ncbi:MAG: hypothetical protein ACI9UT_001766, partial [Flavobacteriales bacterium]
MVYQRPLSLIPFLLVSEVVVVTAWFFTGACT